MFMLTVSCTAHFRQVFVKLSKCIEINVYLQVEPIYESYDPLDINSDSSNKVEVMANEYYNDDYCTFTDK